MTVEQAKQLKSGDWIHHTQFKMKNGEPWRAKVTSMKTWKRDLNRVEVKWKQGLYTYGTITSEWLKNVEPGDGR